MDKSFIPLSIPNLIGNEQKYTANALEDGWVSTGGAYISQFENDIVQYVHAAGAVACQSGTAGLHLALLACGVDATHEVIVPTLTFVAAVNPVKYVGATPIFMDCDDTLCMDMQKLRRFIETECTFAEGKLSNKRTQKHIKAVVVVHVFGNLADMDSLMELASQYHLKIVEDATEALGSYYLQGKYAGKFAGTIGDVGVYSFNGNKIITTGGGGMLVSDDEQILKKSKYLSTQAKDDELYFIHKAVGYNYRMTNVQAAIGLAQLELLEDFIKVKATNYDQYNQLGMYLLPFRTDIRTNHWFYSYLTDKRDELIQYLTANRIQARPVWYLIHKLEPYQYAQSFEIKKAEYYWDKIVNIPCSTNLSKDDVKVVAQAILRFE
ncbi:LegC family aminotransferase [Oscillospiraceae bacterium PP1C4]